MYVIQDDFNLYWAGIECGRDYWSNKLTRARKFYSIEDAEKGIVEYELDFCEIVYIHDREK